MNRRLTYARNQNGSGQQVKEAAVAVAQKTIAAKTGRFSTQFM